MATLKKSKLPPFLRLTVNEAQCIAKMFRIFDTHSTGRVANYSAERIAQTLGVRDISRSMFSAEVTLNELLLTVDQYMPETEPALLSSLTTFTSLEALETEHGRVFNPEIISKFMEKLDRPPAQLSEASLMLNSMLEYDDCSEVPIVSASAFSSALISFAKKHNAFKDYRGDQP
jgi:hypothetical protein